MIHSDFITFFFGPKYAIDFMLIISESIYVQYHRIVASHKSEFLNCIVITESWATWNDVWL